MKRFVFALLAFAAPALAAPEVAFTFDDLPVHAALPQGQSRVGIAKQMIAALKAAKLPPAYGFVNAVGIANEPASAPVLNLWRASGNHLGNHTWSHPGLTKLTVPEYEDEIIRNEPAIAELGGDWHWFRYPFLDEGDTPEKRAEVRSFLAARGYKIATVTMAFGDWLYSDVYARCVAKDDKSAIAQMERYYLTAAANYITYSRAQAKALYGHDIPYVLLLHIGAFEARTLPQLIALYRKHGFKFISLEQAEADPSYQAYTDPNLPAPPKDMEQLMKARNLTPPPAPTMYETELNAMCR